MSCSTARATMIRSLIARSAVGWPTAGLRLSTQRRFASSFIENIKEALKDEEGPVYPEDLKELPRVDPGVLHRPIVNPTENYVETVENLHEYGRYVMAALPKFIQKFSVWKDELTLYVAPSAIIPVMTFLRDHTAAQFKAVMDVTAADYPTRSHRFDVVYNMLSTRFSSRIRVKTYASETTPVPSITELFEGANWYERETYDLFGVFFVNHPDLRRIMTDYGFEGHPLRKDFPLTGYTEVRYDEEKKRIVYEPLELTQGFRNFSVGSTVWEPVGPGKDERPKTFILPTPEPEEKSEEPAK
ncbi:uncharacterized protein V1518DRAFT_410020 [Limtongia smithiae]|uniref:uncharacterized protein n=1 Tax=Limtongia smithiae TaxID=1125753 RepID=UPI0034CEC8E9